jgi:hypothetical protein
MRFNISHLIIAILSDSLDGGAMPQRRMNPHGVSSGLIPTDKNVASQFEELWFSIETNSVRPDMSRWETGEEIVTANALVGGNNGQRGILRVQYPAIHRGDRTGVYNIKGFPDKVIKYYANCYMVSNPVDQMIVEYYFMQRLGPRGMSPKAYYLSGAEHVESGTKPSDSAKVRYPVCRNGTSGDIRFMIMEKVGDSLFITMKKFKSQKFPFILAIHYGIQMIELLERYHTENFIHGDIHLGNFAFSGPNDKLILIDFGRTEYVDPMEQESTRTRNAGFFCLQVGKEPNSKWRIHPYPSKWEMRRCKPAFRDDVHRAVQMIAHAMYGSKHFNYLRTLISEDKQKFVEIKDRADFFTLDNSEKFNLRQNINESFPGGNISDSDYLDILNSLNVISAEVSKDDPKNPYRKPWYGLIISELEKISDKFAK